MVTNECGMMITVLPASTADTADIGNYRVLGRIGGGTFGEVRHVAGLLRPAKTSTGKMLALCARAAH